MLKKYLDTGEIIGTHGLKGEMRVQPWCDSPAFLTEFKKLYLDENGNTALEITGSRVHGNIVLIKAVGVDDVSSAERFRGKILYLDRSDIPLEEDCYFVQDLIGCKVVDADSGVPYGVLTDVSKTGANDVWHIKKDGREFLIPVIPDVVITTDVENEHIEIRPIKGMFEDED